MPIFIGVVALTVLSYAGLRRLNPRKRTAVINSLNEFSAMAGVLNRALTTVDSVRHVVLWMDTWKTDSNGEIDPSARMGLPPIGVPVPVKTNGAPAPAITPTSVSGPQQYKAPIDASIFE